MAAQQWLVMPWDIPQRQRLVGTFSHNGVRDTHRQIHWPHQTQQWPNGPTRNLNLVHTRENLRKPEFPHQQFHLTPNWDGPKQLNIEGTEKRASTLWKRGNCHI
ncbi:hypothetical protein HJC23_004543 [Cyclotella cryptica]|uniref:Uncharacterized protein n=1 Tax=Cyclotella cryptica TaxID=29204 RepID=A0ABD3QBZ6_9STRA